MDTVTQPQEEIAKLKAIIASMDKSAMMLVHRDLELRRAKQRLTELDKNKSEFVTIAAHQMRTPLSAIRWSQQMLKNEESGTLNESQKQIVVQTLESVKGLVTLVNNLLTADHLEIGKGNDGAKVVNITSVINEVLSDCYADANEKKVTLEFPQSDIVACVNMNPDRIRDIIQNLLENAIKYTPEGGRVSVGIELGEMISIKVSDTGIGIPPEHVSKVFSRFYRADNAKRVDPNGSGLGLYIVKRIVEANNGTIKFEGTPGGGTTFIIQLQKASD